VFDTALAVLLCDVAWFGIHLILLDCGECIWVHIHFWAIYGIRRGGPSPHCLALSKINNRDWIFLKNVGYCIIV
jgi:hypothetical protein